MSDIKQVVRQKYGEAAVRAGQGLKAGCGCGTSGCGGTDPITSNLYDDDAGRRDSGRGAAGVARVRESDGACRAEAR